VTTIVPRHGAPRTGDPRGQVLAIVAVGMIGILAMVGLVIDYQDRHTTEIKSVD